MKVVVYFRQAGGAVAETYPLITHWAEDEAEQPVPLFSQFDTDGMSDAGPDILVQLHSANRWLKEKRGVVVAIFTELEDGSGRRPSYGAARKAAGRERATVLIATTKAFAGQRFSPISQDGLEVIRLEDVIPSLDAIQAEGDVQTGINLVKRAVEEPVRQIANNAGLEGSVIVEKMKEQKPCVGFNSATDEWVDMIKAGIVDPTKVTRSALQNAASVSALLLTTEAVVAEKPEENAPAAPAAPNPGMGGMM